MSATASGQWQPVSVPSAANLRGLSVVDSAVIWASGTGGTVLRSLDGGKVWIAMEVPRAEDLDFRGIRGFDAETAIVMSSGPAQDGKARIYQTKDGGKTWSVIFQGKTNGVFLDAIAFWDREHSIVLSDPVDGRFVIFATADGGTRWTQISPERLPAALPNEGAFAASNSCLTVEGESNAWFVTGGGAIARVFRSNDRGKSWKTSDTAVHPKGASAGLFSVAFSDRIHGVAAGGDYKNPTASEVSVLVTEDGGKTWFEGGPTTPAGLYISSVVFVPGTRATFLASGPAGSDFSVDGGRNWALASTNGFNVLSFRSLDEGWAAGSKGEVARFTGDFRSQKRPSLNEAPR